MLKTVIICLYANWLDDPQIVTAYSRANGAYAKGSRYRSLFVSRSIVGVIDSLIVAGFVDGRLGFIDRRQKVARLSRMWPSEALIAGFMTVAASRPRITRDPYEEVIILRSRRCPISVDEESGTDERVNNHPTQVDIEYVDTEETIRMRDRLQRYNRLLSSTFVSILPLATTHSPHSGDNISYVIHPWNMTTRRVFLRSSFDFGGRYYRGEWQNYSQTKRSRIFINDEATVELDFSCLHPVLVYARKGIDYWTQVKRDVYEIEPLPFLEDDILRRKVTKSLFLFSMNAESESSAFSAFRQKANRKRVKALKRLSALKSQLVHHSDHEIAARTRDIATLTLMSRLTNAQLRSVLNSLKAAHPEIADSFATDVGISLMREDSTIAEFIIDHFTEKGIAVLGVHDSFIIDQRHENELREVMCDAFRSVTGFSHPRIDKKAKPFRPSEVVRPPHMKHLWRLHFEAAANEGMVGASKGSVESWAEVGD